MVFTSATKALPTGSFALAKAPLSGFSTGFAAKRICTMLSKRNWAGKLSMVIYFCGYYYARQLGVLALEGKEGFGGPKEIYDNVFIPILTTHLVLVTLGLIMAFYMVIEGFRASEKSDGEFVLRVGELKVKPRSFKILIYCILGFWALNQLFLSFVRHASTRVSIAWALIFGTIALVASAS